MGVSVEVFTPSSFEEAPRPPSTVCPLWNHPAVLLPAEKCQLLVARRGRTITGWWLVPIVTENTRTVARRSCRFLPYAAPWLLEESPLSRRETITRLLETLLSGVDGLELPMEPGFVDLPVAISLGCFAEWRHTYVLSATDNPFGSFSPKVRNHIRAAEQTVQVVYDSPNEFAFEKAIRGAGTACFQLRKQFALELLHQHRAVTFTAFSERGVVGGAFLTFDHDTVYLLHLWSDRHAGRGISSLLIQESIRWTFLTKRLHRFDFEGSILASVDAFMSGFGARIEPYAYIYWDVDREYLLRSLRRSIEIEGRVNP